MAHKITYIVHIMGAKRCFAVAKMAEFGTACFHGTGVWTSADPTGKEEELDVSSMSDEYIPWHRIDHITNRMYKPR